MSSGKAQAFELHGRHYQGGTLWAICINHQAGLTKTKFMNEPFNKASIINRLAEVHAYGAYLEFCTGTTGHRYSEIDTGVLTGRRLLYNCPEDFDDGMKIDYRSFDIDITDCLETIQREGRSFDIALIDPFHDYETSLRDIDVGFSLIREGGTLVVHDCLPREADIAGPEYIDGEWCGVTYQAFIDFVNTRGPLDFYTVDTDYGCGVIRKRGNLKPMEKIGRWASHVRNAIYPDAQSELMKQWTESQDDHNRRFELLQAHDKALLRLISVEDFLATERLPDR